MNSYTIMSKQVDKELDAQIAAKAPQPAKKRKERKKAEEDIQSTKPQTTQLGKKRNTKAEKSLLLYKQRQEKVVKKIPRSRAEQSLLRASTKQLTKVAKGLKIEGTSNLRKADLIILIIREWNNCPKI